jgi:hypothetical protein
MNKKTLQNIKNLSSFIFEEQDYNYFMKLIINNKLNKARIFLNDKIDYFDIEIHLNEDDEILLSQYKKLNELEDIVMNLIINDKGIERGENKQIITR